MLDYLHIILMWDDLLFEFILFIRLLFAGVLTSDIKTDLQKNVCLLPLHLQYQIGHILLSPICF